MGAEVRASDGSPWEGSSRWGTSLLVVMCAERGLARGVRQAPLRGDWTSLPRGLRHAAGLPKKGRRPRKSGCLGGRARGLVVGGCGDGAGCGS